ncbi:MAG: hypothetical protein AAGK57_06325 [Pseudomonadota bacterium]
MVELAKYFASNWLTWWVAGLVLSYRMIVPAQDFLSERSADWLRQTILSTRNATVRRRFNVSFKRYVDRTFAARQRTLGGCKIWTLRYRNTAVVSFGTFLAIYGLVLLTLDFDLMLRGVEDIFARMQDPQSPDYNPAMEPFFDIIHTAGAFDLRILLASMLGVNGLFLGLLNTITDYVSFVETRNVLARLGRGPVRDVVWVIVDLILTTMISVLGFVLFWVLTTYFGTMFSGRSLPVLPILEEGLAIALTGLGNALALLIGRAPPLGPTDPAMISMTLSTYATSIWIWVFFAGVLGIRLAVLFAPLLRLIRFVIDVEEHPFRAVWVMFALPWTMLIAYAAFT